MLSRMCVHAAIFRKVQFQVNWNTIIALVSLVQLCYVICVIKYVSSTYTFVQSAIVTTCATCLKSNAQLTFP